MKYYYLGHILEKYYDDCRTGILKHRWDDHLTLWALDMLDFSLICPRWNKSSHPLAMTPCLYSSIKMLSIKSSSITEGSSAIWSSAALAGREHVLAAYEEAVREKYRFFSFGDAMFIS